MASITRALLGAVAIAACWAAGEGLDAATGLLPGPVAGLLLLTVLLSGWPAAAETVGPVADRVVRALPLLFVPAVVAAAGVEGGVDVAALAVGVAVSVPVGFAVAARLAR